jgi:hypothetical protein
MAAAEFEAVKPLLNISNERIEAARLCLVEGRTLQAVGDQFGCSRQSVNESVRVIWKTLENYRESQRVAASAGALLPPGWEQVTLIAPGHLIAKFREDIAQASPSPPKQTRKKKPGVTPGLKVNVNET